MRINETLIKKLIIALLAALGMVSVLQGCKNAITYSQDFQWDAAKVMSLGMNPYDESLNPSDELKALGYEEYYKKLEANQFPSLLMLLFPYTLLPPLAARYAWLVSNLIFTALIILLLRLTFMKDMERQDYVILCLLMLAGTPWRNHIGVGQHSVFSLMFFLLSVYVFERKDTKKASGLIPAALCLCISYFKYSLTAPLALYYVYKRRTDIPILAGLPHIILTWVAARMMGDSFVNMIKKPLEVASWLTCEGSMDISATLSRFGILPSGASMIITVVIMAALAVYAFVMGRRNSLPGDDAVITVLIMTSMVMIYHRAYDYFVMIIPFALVLKKETPFFLRIYYTVLTLYVFFVLRFFGEADAALVPPALGTYIFLIIVTVRSFALPVKATEGKETR